MIWQWELTVNETEFGTPKWSAVLTKSTFGRWNKLPIQLPGMRSRILLLGEGTSFRGSAVLARTTFDKGILEMAVAGDGILTQRAASANEKKRWGKGF